MRQVKCCFTPVLTVECVCVTEIQKEIDGVLRLKLSDCVWRVISVSCFRDCSHIFTRESYFSNDITVIYSVSGGLVFNYLLSFFGSGVHSFKT